MPDHPTEHNHQTSDDSQSSRRPTSNSESATEPRYEQVSTFDKWKSFRYIVYAGGFLVCGMLALIFLGREQARIVGEEFRQVDLQPLVNTEAAFKSKDLEGKVTVMHFWGTWCGPCIVEYPDFAKLYREYQSNEGVQFVSVSCRASQSQSIADLATETAAFLQERSIDMPIYSDPVIYTREQLAIRLPKGGFAYPTTLIINGNGIITEYYRGVAGYDEMKKDIERTLAAN